MTDDYPMILCQVWIPGHPKTKGSLSVVNSGRPAAPGRRKRAAHVEDTPDSKRWRMLMVNRIRAWRADPGPKLDPNLVALTSPYPGPVYVQANFWLPVKPEDLYRRVAGNGDYDKLLRNALDAISANDDPELGAGVIVDDVQVVASGGAKWPALPGASGPGLALEVRRI